MGCCHNFAESFGQFSAELAVIALYPLCAPDQDMIRPGDTSLRQHFPGKCTEAAFHSVADDCIADFLCDRNADAHELVAIIALPHQQDEAGRGLAPALVAGKKIGTLGECRNPRLIGVFSGRGCAQLFAQALRLLRPRARRARRMLRPPTVAMRARKP
jgi:hypothetical protein